MITLGIIGMNEGNGHPFSYSSIFNGYDPIALERDCSFELIKKYLPAEHRNKNFIRDAKVTHIWTQEKRISELISNVALIPNIVDNMEDLIGEVDAVILARDDPWNHLEMALPFMKKRIPIFIDKQLSSTKEDLLEFKRILSPDYPIMACSSSRYTRDIADLRKKNILHHTKTVHGVSRVNWMRYGHHLLEGICSIVGTNVKFVKSLPAKPGHEIMQIVYSDGLNLLFEFITDISLPIQFTCYSSKFTPKVVPFTDYFNSFKKMMENFVTLVKTGKKDIEIDEIISIASIVLAGDISMKNNGIAISPTTLREIK